MLCYRTAVLLSFDTKLLQLPRRLKYSLDKAETLTVLSRELTMTSLMHLVVVDCE